MGLIYLKVQIYYQYKPICFYFDIFVKTPQIRLTNNSA